MRLALRHLPHRLTTYNALSPSFFHINHSRRVLALPLRHLTTMVHPAPTPIAPETDHYHSHSPPPPTTNTTDSPLPTKRIISRAHLQTFLESATHAHLVNFLEDLNESSIGLTLTDYVFESHVRPFKLRLNAGELLLTERVLPPPSSFSGRRSNPQSTGSSRTDHSRHSSHRQR